MFYVLPLRTHYVLLSRKSKHKTYVLSKQQGQRAKNHKVLSENYCVMETFQKESCYTVYSGTEQTCLNCSLFKKSLRSRFEIDPCYSCD